MLTYSSSDSSARPLASRRQNRSPCLPEELLVVIARLLALEDLQVFIMAGRACFRIGTPLLWKVVRGSHRLLLLLCHGSPTSLKPYYEAYRFSGSISAGKNLQHCIMETIDLGLMERFDMYAQHVHELYLGLGVLPAAVLHHFMFVRAERPLLPNIERLVIGFNDGSHKWATHSNNPFAAAHDYVALFLSPSLKSLSLYCDETAINAAHILSYAPSLQEMHLSCARSLLARSSFGSCFLCDSQGFPCYPHRRAAGVSWPRYAKEWSHTMVETLHLWTRLTHLVLHGSFLRSLNAWERISSLRHLVSLELDSPSTVSTVHTLQLGDCSFPRLSQLVVRSPDPWVAKSIFDLVPLMKGILELEWNMERYSGPFNLPGHVAAFLAMAERAKSLQVLRILGSVPRDAPWWENTRVHSALKRLSLSEFMTDYDTYYLTSFSMFSMILSLGPQLVSLSLQRIYVPAQIIELIAHTYPGLIYLRCTIDTQTFAHEQLNQELPGRQTIVSHDQIPHIQPITLVVEFISYGLSETFSGVQNMDPSTMAQYLLDLWPSLVILEDPESLGAGHGEVYFAAMESYMPPVFLNISKIL